MRTLNPKSICGFIILFLLAPALYASPSTSHRKGAKKIKAARAHKISRSSITLSEAYKEEVSCLYQQANLDSLGLNKDAFEYAYRGYIYLASHHLVTKNNIISIVDFSQSSRNRRLYVIDIEQRKVLINTFVAHGRASGSEFAHYFSNNQRSHKSSLGFYVTEHTYYGDHGLALRIQGLEKGFNNRACKRNIVVHGSKYVGEDFIRYNRFNGRSFGCPAVPSDEAEDIIETIKDGTCLFVYFPAKKYLSKSKILNS
ncbi:MAG: murein L,D-transpeptidase catalytic domain family protein [Bacteroidetes bacterium]|nr:murein L,D-transpeptidase catalytic domain family protein [Bacteroidota bacterium]